MPTYEYACKSCGEHVEAVQSFKDDPLTECPKCSGPLRKVFGSIGISFKGSGFYRTDSRSSTSGSKAAKSDGSKSESKDGSKSESKSDSSSSKSDSSTSSAKAESA